VLIEKIVWDPKKGSRVLCHKGGDMFYCGKCEDEGYTYGSWFGVGEVNHLLDYFYSALANEIQQLKILMQG